MAHIFSLIRCMIDYCREAKNDVFLKGALLYSEKFSFPKFYSTISDLLMIFPEKSAFQW